MPSPTSKNKRAMKFKNKEGTTKQKKGGKTGFQNAKKNRKSGGGDKVEYDMNMLADLSEADMSDSSDAGDNEEMERESDNNGDFIPLVDAVKKEEEESGDEEEEKNMDFDENDEDEEDEEEQAKEKVVTESRRQKMKERLAQRKATEGRTVFVGNVPTSMTSREIRKMFRPFGTVEAVYQRSLLQMTEKMTKMVMAKHKKEDPQQPELTSTNFFVRYAKEEEAEEAVTKMHGTVLQDHYLRVTLSTKHKFAHNHSIFLGNLPFSVTEDQVRAHFSQCGRVNLVRLLHDKQTGRGTGAGYVEFVERESVAKALEMNGQKFGKRDIRVSKVVKKMKMRNSKGPGTNDNEPRQSGGGGGMDTNNKRTKSANDSNFMVLKRRRQGGGEGGEKKRQGPAKLSKKVRKEIRKRRSGKKAGKSLIT